MKEKLLDVVRSVKAKLVSLWSKILGLKKHLTLKTLSWLVPAVIIVVGLVVLFTVPAPKASDDVANTEDSSRTEGASSPVSVVGNYGSGLLPAASTPGREFTLALAEDGTATFVGDYKTGRLVDEVGTWTREGDRLTVTISQRFGNTLADTVTYVFTVSDSTLSLVEYDFSRWGYLGLTLTRNQ